MSLGRLSPPFLYSFSLLSKTATSSLFVIHLTEISPSTSEKHRFLQYSSPANHDSQPYSARYIPPPPRGGGGGGAPPPPFLFLLWAWGGSPFIFQIFPSTPPLALKYWKYEHVIFRQNTPFLSFTAAADASVDQFITFYFLSSLSPNIFLLSFFRCLFLSISPDHYAFL